ncbi:MAG: SIMPL domain-containing protein, partial [Thermodesulfobacteriota bacterium]
LAVENSAKTASEAAKQNAEKMNSVIGQLKTLISKEDKISTAGYQLFPVYEYDEKTRRSVLTGYRASNQVVVEIKNLSQLGKLIDSSTQVGANRIDSISFGTEKKDEYRRQALVGAVGDAKATAETVAKAAGVRIVKIVRISPSYEVPGPVYRDFLQAKVAAAESAPTPIEPGELTVSATVNIVYEIE